MYTWSQFEDDNVFELADDNPNHLKRHCAEDPSTRAGLASRFFQENAGEASGRAAPAASVSHDRIAALRESASTAASAAPAEEHVHKRCPVCLSHWTNTGPHRIISLRCGHLFGKSCAERWFHGQGRKRTCPTCLKPAGLNDVRPLFVGNIGVSDGTGEARLHEQLMQSQMETKDCRREISRLKAELQQARASLASCHRRLQRYQTPVQQTHLPPVPLWQGAVAQQTPRQGTGSAPLELRASLLSNLMTSLSGMGSQAMELRMIRAVPALNALCVCVRSGSKYGVVVIPLDGNTPGSVAPSSVLPLHSQPIRGIAACPWRPTDADEKFSGACGTDALLTASWDRTVKITRWNTRETVMVVETSAPVWSCCWHPTESDWVMAGTNGAVILIDNRRSSIVRSVATCTTAPLKPVHSLYSTPLGLLAASNRELLLLDIQRVVQTETSDRTECADTEVSVVARNVVLPRACSEESSACSCTTCFYCPVSQRVVLSHRPRHQNMRSHNVAFGLKSLVRSSSSGGKESFFEVSSEQYQRLEGVPSSSGVSHVVCVTEPDTERAHFIQCHPKATPASSVAWTLCDTALHSSPSVALRVMVRDQSSLQDSDESSNLLDVDVLPGPAPILCFLTSSSVMVCQWKDSTTDPAIRTSESLASVAVPQPAAECVPSLLGDATKLPLDNSSPHDSKHDLSHETPRLSTPRIPIDQNHNPNTASAAVQPSVQVQSDRDTTSATVS